jgi:general secretion pathway protein G
MKLVVLKRAFVLGLRGFTLVELIVATAILVILTGLAVPLARVAIKREKERELRTDLWALRDAIDRYKDVADRGAFQIKVGSEGYPPDLETLVKGVDVGGKKMRFLRRIPTDPMTNSTEWGLRSMQDDPASDSWGGQNVFDVFTKAQGTGLDGTEYRIGKLEIRPSCQGKPRTGRGKPTCGYARAEQWVPIAGNQVNACNGEVTPTTDSARERGRSDQSPL